MKHAAAVFIIIAIIMIIFCRNGNCEESPPADTGASRLGILDNLGSPLFEDGDFSSLIYILTSLREKNDPVACFLFEKLSPDLKKPVKDYQYSSSDSDSFKKAITGEINRILSGPCIYDKDRFANVKLFWHTKELLGKGLSGMDLVRLNRMLMEDAFPDLQDADPYVKRRPRFKGDAKARELLEKNGFVVVPNFEKQIFSHYIGSGFPVFVTTDSIFSVFHRNLEESMKQVERAQHERLSLFLKKMISVTASLYKTSKGRERQPLLRNLAFFTVAARLNGDTPEIPGSIYMERLKDTVEAELQRIREEKGVMPSLIFCSSGDHHIDYSTFRPRGFYTGDEKLSHYFSAITWLGDFAFRVISDDETLSALMVMKAFRDDQEVLWLYRDIEDTAEFCWGRSDDLTVEEYLDAARRVWVNSIDINGPAYAERLRKFQSHLRKMRDPVINSEPSPTPQAGLEDVKAKGLCLFGKRVLPDSWAFECLSHPGVPGKKFASGLDVMNALGSSRASAILEKTSQDSKSPAYARALGKAQKGLEKENEVTKGDNIYAGYLKMMQRFISDRDTEWAPACRNTEAWKDRKLNTALASWAMMRHTWGLQARKKVSLIGGYSGEPGYVEPEIQFYADLRELNNKCRDKFLSLGLETGHYNEIETVLEQLIDISEKELKRESFSDDDRNFLNQYGKQTAHLCFYENESYMDDIDEMALITDTASDGQSGEVLYEGIGGAMEIYVIVNFKEGPVLTKGGVLSYYEFTEPAGERLTDEEWKDMVTRRVTPDLPEWVGSFTAFHDNDRIFEELRKGKVLEEARSSRDERIVPFLINSLRDDSVFSDSPELYHGRTMRQKALSLLIIKGGKRAVPVLIKLLDDSDYRIRLTSALVLAMFRDQSIIPELLSIYETGKRPSACQALEIIGRIRCPDSKEILVRALKDNKEMSGSPLIETGEIDHPDSLVESLKKPRESFFTFICSRLSASTRQLLLNCENSDYPSQALVKAIVSDLNLLISGPSIYQKERFAGITLRKRTLELLDRGGKEGECTWQNRMLLEDAFPYIIHESNDYSRIALNNLIYIYRACEYNDDYLSFLREKKDFEKVRAIKAIGYLWAGDRYISRHLEESRRNDMVYPEGSYWAVGDGTPEGVTEIWRYPTQWSSEEILARDRTVSLLMEIASTEKNSSIRDEALDALGFIGDEKAIPLLIKADAIYELCDIGGERVESYFIERLKKQFASHSEELKWTMDCLGRLKCKRAVPLIVDLLEDRTVLQKNSGPDDRLLCDSALEVLLKLAPQSPQCDLIEYLHRGMLDEVITRWKEWWGTEGKAQEWK